MAKEKAIAEIKGDAVFILQAGTSVYLKTADVCRMTGKSNQWIGQLTSQGVLAKKQTPHGTLYEMGETISGYLKYTEERYNEQDENDKKVERVKSAAEAKLKKAKAEIADFDAKERAGEMHRSEDVAAMTEDLIFTIRGGLLALPGRLAVEVANAKDSAEASEIIKKEVYRLLEELAAYKYDSAKYQERVRERLNLKPADYPDNDD